MRKNKKLHFRKRKAPTPAETRAKDFIDMTVPGVLKFNADHYICGNTFRSVWAVREYPSTTDEKAILRHLGEKGNVMLHVYSRAVSAMEERKIIQNAANKHKMDSTSSTDISQSIGAEANLRDVAALVQALRDNREPLLHCAVFLELVARDAEELKLLQTEVYAELTRSKINVDKLLLRQQQGFLSAMPGGANRFGEQFERALPASSVANLYPFNYSGKTDAHGFYVGRNKFGSNIIVDLDKREDDKTNGSALILGNSGQQGKHCMLVLGEKTDAGVAIEAEGYDYARYAAYVPGAKTLVEKEVQQAVSHIIRGGVRETSDGSWNMQFDELENQLGLKVSSNNGLGKMIYEALYSREEVLEVEITEDGFNIIFDPDHCQNLCELQELHYDEDQTMG